MPSHNKTLTVTPPKETQPYPQPNLSIPLELNTGPAVS
ncbi:predicted protein [Plenodomus lingam JN3]|uniref:Predicted protein n=1 Tax=Leptosphaeria maculans (strain JN3 / isolate v23.1.3 / race Av1-4-5-6-7-8) TaxID=985895 RepID=E4ZUP0_LEPMJ|nr:predicted protein [Plenodomus lingam JN3]CBX95119.1 predicted protein [Plenodomus lingam JN3]